MIVLLRRRHLAAVTAALLLTVGGALTLTGRLAETAATVQDGSWQVIVLDAGHGGEDGGAVSPDGVSESSLNLAIVYRLRDVFCFLGRETLLTRSTEAAIYSPEAQSLREKKRSDLENRVALVNAQSQPVLISIHQNSLPAHPSVHGAQVFCNAVEPAAALSQAVQAALNQSVNPGNEKAAKAIDSSIYLMKNVRCPAILVECGFLSNAADTQLLLTAQHQLKLALSIAAGFLEYDTERGHI